MIKYFHEITESEWEAMKEKRRTWGQVAKEYAQPDWCGYPVAVDAMGCWSLIAIGKDCRITKEDDCKKCPLYKGVK